MTPTFYIPGHLSTDENLLYEFAGSSSLYKYYCQGIKAIDHSSFYVAMISNTPSDGNSVELYQNTIDASLNLISNKKFWRTNLGTNLQLVRMVDSNRLFVVSKSVFDNYANGGVFNSFSYVPLIYFTDPSYSYIDVSWETTTPINQTPSKYNPNNN